MTAPRDIRAPFARTLLPVWLVLLTLVMGMPAVSQTITIRNASVVSVRDGRVLQRSSVVIEGNRITYVGPARTQDSAPDVSVDATGLYLIPGLWDMHTHAFFGADTLGFRHSRELMLPLFIANGITGIRDMGSNLDAVIGAGDSIAARQLLGPRMMVSGPMLDGPNSGYTAALRVSSAEDGRAAVRMLKERGVDFIKTQSGIPREAYFAIAEEARRLRIPFEGHVPDAIRATEAIAAQQASFEHLLGVFEASSRDEDAMLAGGKKGRAEYVATADSTRQRSIIRALAQHRVWQCPTMISDLNTALDFLTDPGLPYAPRRAVDGWRQGALSFMTSTDTAARLVRERFREYELDLVRKLHRAGVPFLAGTDTPAGFDLLPGTSLHRELEWFVAAGFTPLEALQTATINPAAFLNRSRDFGTVASGKIADLVLLSGNPLADISNTRRIVGVVADGKYYSLSDLVRLRLQLMGLANQ